MLIAVFAALGGIVWLRANWLSRHASMCDRCIAFVGHRWKLSSKADMMREKHLAYSKSRTARDDFNVGTVKGVSVNMNLDVTPREPTGKMLKTDLRPGSDRLFPSSPRSMSFTGAPGKFIFLLCCLIYPNKTAMRYDSSDHDHRHGGSYRVSRSL